MQSQVVTTSTVTAGEPSALSRTRARITGARTVTELREQLTAVLALLYRAGSRSELFVARGEHLVPSTDDADEARVFRGLLASVRTRLHTSGRSLSEPQALVSHETPGRRAVLTAPVHGPSDDLVGLLVVEGAPSRAAFERVELVALEGVAGRAAMALQRLEPTGTTPTSRARRDLDRVAACNVQRGFLSARLPPGIGVTASAEYLPAFEVGGDFYSVKYLGDRTVTATIGDVSGNGVAAALLMSRVTADLERFVASGASPADVLSQVHARLAPGAGDMFVTAACVKIDANRRRLTVANAGHLPMIVRRANDEVFTFGGASGVPLGMMSCVYAEDDLLIERGDIFLLLTDGLLEALDPPTGHRGMELLVDEVYAAGHDTAAINDRIRAAVDRARESHTLDDVTWVGLQLTA
jgi:serine phosphatase RsbU (regulator of sigma subunit)